MPKPAVGKTLSSKQQLTRMTKKRIYFFTRKNPESSRKNMNSFMKDNGDVGSKICCEEQDVGDTTTFSTMTTYR